MLPCIESYQKVDLRTITLGVPPQEVSRRKTVPISAGILNLGGDAVATDMQMSSPLRAKLGFSGIAAGFDAC